MNGTLIPHTPIAVDFWKIRECPHARIFFLTHLHGDHITGLTSSWSFPIYCSEITGKLLVQRYGIKEDLIHTLQTECAEIIYLDNEHKEQMTVTAIEANHCPGTVMFLMQGYFGTILHTGDFRYHQDMITQSILSDFSGKVDMLYLDNTYCSPGCVFPTKDEATSQIIDIIEKHPNKDVLIAMRNLGKESLLCKIAVHFHEWISVPDKFYRTLEILEAPNVFETGISNHRIRVVPFHKISNKFVELVNQEHETIVILPTALYRGIECKPYENNDKVFVVPYSDHSSYTELIEFVSFIKPKKIIPIVKSNSRGPFGLSIADRADMACFDKFTSHGWNSRIEIPVSVQAFMYCKSHKVLMIEEKGQKRKMKQRQPQTKKQKRGIAYDSPVSASKQKIRSPISASKQKNMELKNNKENLKKVCKDSPHVRQLLFDQIAEKRSKCGRIQVQKDSVEITEKDKVRNHNVMKNCSGEQLQLISKKHEKNKKCEQKEVSDGSSIENISKEKEEIHKEICREASPDQFGGNTRERFRKRNEEKNPVHFVSMNNNSPFDNLFGMRTYSRSNKKHLCSDDLIELKKIEIEEDIKMNETAKWVLESSQFGGIPENQDDRVSDSNKSDISLISLITMHKETKDYEKELTYKSVIPAYERKVNGIEKSIERKKTKKCVLEFKPKLSSEKKSGSSRKPENTKLKFGKQNDRKELVSQEMKDGKLNVSVCLKQLKQSTISQYVKTRKCEVKTNLKETASQEHEIYFATKLCLDSVENGESLPNEDVHLNAFEIDEEILRQNSNEIKEKKERTNYYEQTEDDSVTITDSNFEKEFKELNTAEKDFILGKITSKGYLSKGDKRKSHVSDRNAGISKRDERKGNACNTEAEMIVEQDSFNESLIAQIGTQVRDLNVSHDNDSTAKNEAKHTKPGVKSNDILEKLMGKNKQSQGDNSIVTSDNSFAFPDSISRSDIAHHNIENGRENNETSEDIGASKLCEEGDLSTYVNIGSQNKATVTGGNKSTVSEVDIKLLTHLNYDTNMSALANIGSKKQVLDFKDTEGTVTKTKANTDESKTQLSKNDLKNLEGEKVGEYKVSNCRECELDAFEQAFDDLEIDELSKIMEGPPSKEHDDNHARATQRRLKERCSKVIKCSFSVKPINVL